MRVLQTALFVLLWLLVMAFVLYTARAEPKSQTLYGPDGRVITRSTTDSQGSTTFYGRDGRMQGRASETPTGTIYYDPTGRVIGKKAKQ